MYGLAHVTANYSYVVNAHYRKQGFGEGNKTQGHMTSTIITKSVLQFRFTVLSLSETLDPFLLSQNQ
jgi:hypothetical protein